MTNPISRRLAFSLAGALALCVTMNPALAQDDWPGRTLTLIVPFSAGGSADRVARNLAPFLEEELGTSIVVENKPGASGQVGTMQMLARPADGNTVLLNAQPYFSASIVLQGAPYSLADLEALNVQNVGNISVTVKADAPYETFADLDAAIKENPGGISVGTVRGGGSHLLTLLLRDELGWDVRIVTYDSGAPVRTALLGGQIDFSLNGAVSDAAMKPEVRSLGLSTSQKIAAFPDAPYFNDLPTVADQGITLPETGDIRFLAVKAGTQVEYPERFEKLRAAYEAVLNNPDYVGILETQGEAEETAYRGPEDSTRILTEADELMRNYADAFGK
ncbi:MAG: Bug family tripartite tricarboxylate transporter substrate binding protein [Pseudorhodobacter sp.]